MCSSDLFPSHDIRVLVSKSWSYGRTDCSLSRGSAAGYVASYINSFVDLPDFFNRHKEIKPRSYHSKGLSVNSLFRQSSDVSEVQTVADSCFDGFSVPINGEYVTVKPSRSYERTLFPRISDPVFADSYSCVDLFFGALERILSLYCQLFFSLTRCRVSFR